MPCPAEDSRGDSACGGGSRGALGCVCSKWQWTGAGRPAAATQTRRVSGPRGYNLKKWLRREAREWCTALELRLGRGQSAGRRQVPAAVWTLTGLSQARCGPPSRVTAAVPHPPQCDAFCVWNTPGPGGPWGQGRASRRRGHLRRGDTARAEAPGAAEPGLGVGGHRGFEGEHDRTPGTQPRGVCPPRSALPRHPSGSRRLGQCGPCPVGSLSRTILGAGELPGLREVGTDRGHPEAHGLFCARCPAVAKLLSRAPRDLALAITVPPSSQWSFQAQPAPHGGRAAASAPASQPKAGRGEGRG